MNKNRFMYCKIGGNIESNKNKCNFAKNNKQISIKTINCFHKLSKTPKCLFRRNSDTYK